MESGLAVEQSMADQEEYSYRAALEFLSDPNLKKGALIEVYHTGLQPMVVGFYRGVVETLRRRLKARRPRKLTLRPMFFGMKDHTDHFGPDSIGAKRENYIVDQDWL